VEGAGDVGCGRICRAGKPAVPAFCILLGCLGGFTGGDGVVGARNFADGASAVLGGGRGGGCGLGWCDAEPRREGDGWRASRLLLASLVVVVVVVYRLLAEPVEVLLLLQGEVLLELGGVPR
jgi:hypothetical protein